MQSLTSNSEFPKTDCYRLSLTLSVIGIIWSMFQRSKDKNFFSKVKHWFLMTRKPLKTTRAFLLLLSIKKTKYKWRWTGHCNWFWHFKNRTFDCRTALLYTNMMKQENWRIRELRKNRVTAPFKLSVKDAVLNFIGMTSFINIASFVKASLIRFKGFKETSRTSL